MAWSLLVAGACSFIPMDNKAHLGLMALFIYIFAMFYSPGEGACSFASVAMARP
jgi:hypothetical protein